MTLMYLLVIIHINNKSTLYKVDGVVGSGFSMYCAPRIPQGHFKIFSVFYQ
jgi:hypothetical protein